MTRLQANAKTSLEPVNIQHRMSRLVRLLIMAGITAVTLMPLAVQADSSKCTARIKAKGFFITDIDSD